MSDIISKALLSAADRARIAEAISAAETRTSGEVLAVVTQASDDYRFTALLWAALIALLAPALLVFMPQLTGYRFSFAPLETILLGQLALFAALALLFQLQPLRLLLAPRQLKQAQAHQKAVQQFIAQNLHGTAHRTGVLIFVSIAERYAEILADDGVYEKVSPGVWDDAVNRLTQGISKGAPADGFVAAIELCADVLAQHFPAGGEQNDELPNHLIEI